MSLPTASHVRQQFLDFFASKGHHIVPSAPLVVKDDPTLLFINSGMAPFKDYFLGNKPAPFRRVADTQKCLRVSGKHNDLEEVGYDTYHHTMFEMLGNWSFGDYFKKDAIAWAWELLTEVYKLPKERLYVTYFEGDQGDGLGPDTETQALWRQYTTDDRILPGNKKDNFWEMGDTGPCGPCTEIHIDLRDEAEVAQKKGSELVNADHPQVVEIWNNVFMEFQRLADKSLIKLPAQSVDTGMGFERLMMAVSGVKSNYDTDVFQPLIQFIAKEAGVQYHGTAPATVTDQPTTENERTDIAIRVLADHIRAIAFTIADGQLPSNVKAGYVIRRILRRAVRYAFSSLNQKQPFLYKLVPVLADQMAGIFPELKAQQAFVMRVIEEEEIAFLKTLETGLRRLDALEETARQNGGVIDGKTAFELSDTFGFPLDLTALIAREKGLGVDEEGFKKELEQQKNRSRNAQETEQSDWVTVTETDAPNQFVGYDQDEATARLLRYRKVDKKGKTEYQLVLDQTPFYAESGGQVGDTGYLDGPLSRVRVIDTKKENDLIIHTTLELPHRIERTARKLTLINAAHHARVAHVACFVDLEAHEYPPGQTVAQRLRGVAHPLLNSHHDGLLPAVAFRVHGHYLVRVVGYGLAIGAEALAGCRAIQRQLVTPAQLAVGVVHQPLAGLRLGGLVGLHVQLPTLVNERIRQQIPLDERRNVPIDEAKGLGAMALFGEKYGEFVRVITFDRDYSVELCGGLHVANTGSIGYFKITSESAVGAGVRRIEAVTAGAAEAYVDQQLDLLTQVREALGNPQHLLTSLEKQSEEVAALRKQIEQFAQQSINQQREQLVGQAKPVGGHQFLAAQVQAASADALKTLAFGLRQQVPNLVAVLGAEIDGKPQLAVILDDDIAKAGKLNATTLVRELAKEIQGGGGGQPFFATAGGKNVAGLGAALAKAEGLVAAAGA